MQTIWRPVGLISILAALLIPALTFANPKGTPTKPASAPRGASGASLRLAIPNAAATVDPALVADEENDQLANLLYSGLVRLDASYHVVPDAAAKFSISADHRTYTFTLRKGLRFSNGDPVTASDFRFSITRSLNPNVKSPSAPTYLLDIQGAHDVLTGKATSVSGIKVLDSQTLQITTIWPVPYFLMELTYPTSFVLDRKLISKQGPPENTNWYAQPVGTGPYRLKTWIPNTKMVLVPNKYFYGSRPPLKSISVSLAPLPDTGVYSWVSHNLDVVSLPSYSTAVLGKTGIHETKMLAVDGVYMNFNSKPFSNIHIRRAFTLALNRTSLVTASLGSTVTPFEAQVPPGQAGYDTQLHPLVHDKSAARAELRAASASSRKAATGITLYYADDPTLAKLALAIAAAWKTVLKINVDTHALTLNTLLAKVQAGTLPLYLSGWSADYPDPHDFLTLLWRTDEANNNVHFSDKRFDDTVETADVTWQYAQRMKLYNAAQQILVDDAAWIPLYIPHRLVYIRPTVTNLVLTGYGLIPRDGTWAKVYVKTVSAGTRHLQ